jgi:hypothetical protein
MTNRDHSLFRLDRRAVSEVVGYTLLIGITTVTVVALLVAATSLHGALQGSAETESVEQEMQDVDATFGRLAQGDNRSSVRVRTETSNHLSVVREGQVTVTVNDNCSVQVPLSSIRYEKDGETFANELGGTIRVTDGGQAMVSSPDLYFDNGTVDLTITNITGRTASTMTFVKDVNSSMGGNETDQILFNGTCARPDNVTVSITSDYSDAWERYAEEEFPAGTVNTSGKTVNVTLTTKHLPEAADPANNTVVNFSNTSHYDHDDDVPSFTIDKPDDSNVYPVRMVPIYQGVQVTRTDETEVDAEFYRKGIDVVFVLDQTGSMTNKTPDDVKKILALKNSSKLFVGYLNNSLDRVGIVGYSTYFSGDATYHLTDEEYLSNSFNNGGNQVNETIDDLENGYGTRINKGIYKMLGMYDLTGSSNQDQIALLLTDGKNSNPSSDNDRTINRSKDAAANDIVIHTVGFGKSDDLNETLLQKVANITDGDYYYASNSTNLEEAFRDIVKSITSRKKVVHDPASMELVAGSTFRPNIPTSPDYVADYNGTLNINDPSANAKFSFTFGLENGQPLNLTAYKYECEDDGWELTGAVKVKNTSDEDQNQYYVTRCADINNNATPEEVTAEDIHVFTDGDPTSDVNDTDDGLGETKWYQANYSEVLKPYVTNGTFDLKSNQAIVGVNYSNGQRMLLLLKIGRNRADNDLTHVVDVKIDDVEVKEKDEQGG